jgi:hypothetical protein
MDTETVNRLHKEMKEAEDKWLKSSALADKKTADSKSLYAEFICAWLDWKKASGELDKEVEQLR